MQIIYSHAVGKHHFSEKFFFLRPGECVLFVMQQEAIIQAMQKRHTYTTRACHAPIVMVLVKSCHDHTDLILENSDLSQFLTDYNCLYEIKAISLLDFFQCQSYEQLIYAYFKHGP